MDQQAIHKMCIYMNLMMNDLIIGVHMTAQKKQYILEIKHQLSIGEADLYEVMGNLIDTQALSGGTGSILVAGSILVDSSLAGKSKGAIALKAIDRSSSTRAKQDGHETLKCLTFEWKLQFV